MKSKWLGAHKKDFQNIACLELGSGYYRLSLFSVSGHSAALQNSYQDIIVPKDNDNSSPQSFHTQFFKNIFHKHSLPKHTKLILLGNHSLVRTIVAWVSVSRSDEAEVTENELENIISQAVWQFLNHYRGAALNDLNVSETEIILLGMRILGVKINGHRVLNPIGFKAKTIEILVEESYLSRHLYTSLKEALPEGGQIAFVSELGLVETETIARASNFETSFNVVHFNPTSVSVVESGLKSNYLDNISDPVISLKGEINWDNNALISRLVNKLSIDSASAASIFTEYAIGRVSSSLHKFISKALKEEWNYISGEVKSYLTANHTLSRSSPNMLLYDYSLPDKLIENRQLRLRPVEADKLFSKIGVSFDFSHSTKSNNLDRLFTPAAGFAEYYFSEGEDELNRLARRRAKWLIQSNSASS